MNKLREWLLTHVWPWSVIVSLQRRLNSLQREHDLACSIHSDYKKQAEWFYQAVRGELTREQLDAVQARMDREAEAECTRIGNIAHSHQAYIAPFPAKGSGIMDPKLEGSPAGNAVRSLAGDASLPRLEDLQRDLTEAGVELEIGGSVAPGEVYKIRPTGE